MAFVRVLENISLRKGSDGYVLAERDETDDKNFVVYIEERRFSEKTTLKSFAKAVLKKDIRIFATKRYPKEDGSTAYAWPPLEGSAFKTLEAQGIITVPETPKPTLNI